MLWYVLGVTVVAGIFDPMWFLATAIALLISGLSFFFKD